ncbi:hypothetical protein C2G38_1935971, partial [Gigaspora rosea]
HLPGMDNVIADYVSRLKFNKHDWMMNPRTFNMIHKLWGPLKVDLFANRLNAQLLIYYSWHPDLTTTAVDTFMQPW